MKKLLCVTSIMVIMSGNYPLFSNPELIEIIKNKVREKFGIDLETEIMVVGHK